MEALLLSFDLRDGSMMVREGKGQPIDIAFLNSYVIRLSSKHFCFYL